MEPSLNRANLRRWFWRVIAWDTTLPILIVGLPYAIEAILPKNQTALLIAAVGLPIVAFFMRLNAGQRQIATNNCSRAILPLQWTALFIGIVLLLFLDCMLITTHLMPPGALFANSTDRLILACLIACYLAMMVVAMYPGRPSQMTSESERPGNE